jgi:hypothetical protein
VIVGGGQAENLLCCFFKGDFGYVPKQHQ